MAVKKAVQSGNVEDAIEKVNDLNPEVSCFIDDVIGCSPHNFPTFSPHLSVFKDNLDFIVCSF